MNDYLSNPINPAELAEKINAVYQKLKHRRSNEKTPQNTLF
jgi:DNA-binding response OmpR family regulator